MPVFLALVSLLLPFIPLDRAGASADEGTVTVRVLYRGGVHPPAMVQVTRDPETCGDTARVQSVTVQPATGGVKDVIVAIEGIKPSTAHGLKPAPAVLSNTQCQFTPHIILLPAGSAVEILNQDPILHNTHIKDDLRTLINVALVPNARPIVKTVERAGLYHVQCDAHKFMQGYMVAFDHPYFAISDEGGYATIRHVPAGTHDLSLWHETLGELRSRVTVPPDGETTVIVEFPPDRMVPSPKLKR